MSVVGLILGRSWSWSEPCLVCALFCCTAADGLLKTVQHRGDTPEVAATVSTSKVLLSPTSPKNVISQGQPV